MADELAAWQTGVTLSGEDSGHPCASAFREGLSEIGWDMTIGTEPPIGVPDYTGSLKCPCGVTLWIEPTSEQRLTWGPHGVETWARYIADPELWPEQLRGDDDDAGS